MRVIRTEKKRKKGDDCEHVQRPWLSELPWKMQTVVNQGLRAPDTHFCKNIKIVCRWMRSVVLQNADKDHTFMCDKKELPMVECLDNEINYCSVHFATHFLYALEIIAYKHPDREVKDCAWRYYRGIVEDLMHLRVEPRVVLSTRLSDVDRTPVVKECPKDEKEDKYIHLL